jgi:DnaJ-class molecular chaperone
MTISKRVWHRTTKKCESCAGIGWIAIYRMRIRHEQLDHWDKCKNCGGTGIIPAPLFIGEKCGESGENGIG